VPGYDPQALLRRDTRAPLDRDPNAPLLNRATQAGYPPGSTFKVVTATAALDSGRFTPQSVVNGDSPKEISGVPLANDGGVSYGDIDLTTALTHSVNTYFAQLGEMVGADTLLEYMDRFGFGSDPEVQLPDDQKAPSGIFVPTGKGGYKQVDSDFDIARVAIGQGGQEGQILATVTQMAEVAATIANGGTLMKPTFVQQVVDPDGRVTDELDPQEQSNVISEETASELADMMTSVVDEGTAADLAGDLGGTTFAGKTGTAEINIEEDLARPWFIAFAPVDDPQIAIAVTTDPCTGCFGGTDAGPIATAVMNQLLSNG
jgi:peptidoglycan glycosyltransferase